LATDKTSDRGIIIQTADLRYIEQRRAEACPECLPLHAPGPIVARERLYAKSRAELVCFVVALTQQVVEFEGPYYENFCI